VITLADDLGGTLDVKLLKLLSRCFVRTRVQKQSHKSTQDGERFFDQKPRKGVLDRLKKTQKLDNKKERAESES